MLIDDPPPSLFMNKPEKTFVDWLIRHLDRLWLRFFEFKGSKLSASYGVILGVSQWSSLCYLDPGYGLELFVWISAWVANVCLML